jgi:hypothetical protein
MRIHDRLWLTDEDHLSKMIHLVLRIPGEIGILIKFALYTGLRGEEIAYVHKTQICDKMLAVIAQNFMLLRRKTTDTLL